VNRQRFFFLVASALVAYWYGFPTNGLSHFDEGQYAFARVWPWIDKFDVDQAFFSPPLYPFLVGLVQHLPITRPDLAGVYISWAACWASLYFGVKLAVAWWGRAAAFPAIVLLLLSPMRLAFGTIGLTDALFTAFLLAALWCATNAFRRNSWQWTLAAALVAGSTWSCKYNGFIALAIIAGFVVHQRSAGSVVRWLLICLVAVAIMAPWYWAIHTHHPEGIEALRKHQQGYLRGLSARVIWENLQFAFGLRAMTPGPSVLLASWTLLVVGWIARRHGIAAVSLALLLAAEEFSFSRLIPVLGVAALPYSVLSARSVVRLPLLFAFAATVVLPGIYTPYLRLWLPAEHVFLLVIAGALAGAGRLTRSSRPHPGVVATAALLLFVPSFVKVVGPAASSLKIPLQEPMATLYFKYHQPREPMRPVEGYWPASLELVDRVRLLQPDGLLVFARPPLLYYLAMSDLRVSVRRVPDERLLLDRIPPGNLIVTDVALRDAKQISASLREARRRRMLHRIDGWWVSPHPLTMFDDFGFHEPQDYANYKITLQLLAPFEGTGQ
jgi:4-amino-4-deoxy-L-arabinose transferase-like glycosyltransferase